MSDGKAGKERSAMCLQIFTDKNMMKIIVEKTQYHRFSLYYDYTQERVDFCKDLKDSFGWKSFSFDSSAGLKRWVFSESLLVPVIKERFPETYVDPMVEEVVAHEQKWAAEAKKKETQLSEIKTKTDTNFTIKGLKKALYPYQKVGVEFLTVSGGRAIVADAPGLGKAQPLWAKVLTPQGWKKIGDLKIDDAVCMVNGSYSRVTGVFDRGIMDVYKITFNDGSITHVSEDHLWKISVSDGKWFVAPTWEIVSRLKRKQKIHIPLVKPVMGHGKKLLVSPYLLGLLLGDGGLTGHSVIITTTDNEIKSFCEHSANRLGLKLNPETKTNEGISYRFTTGITGKSNILLDRLRTLKVQGKGAREKIIPQIYLHSSRRQRLELLRGLMDTDGWISTDNVTGFCSTSEKLVEGVSQLIRSLGGISRKSYKKSVDAWTLTVNMPVNPFKLTRKANKWKFFIKYLPTRLFKKIEKIGKEEVRCISVSASDRLYITDEYIVTHNTAQALAYIKHTDCQRTLVVAPASVKFSWKLEAEKWTRMSCEVIDSKTDLAKIRPETRIWIINYDILKKHYEQLSKIRFDCMIGDECQLIKSTKALRTKAFRAISRHIPAIILLSGTPLLSRPSELFSLLNIVDPATWDNFYDFARRYCNAHQTRWGLDTSGVSNPEELHARIKGYFIRRNKDEVLKELPPKTFIDVPVKLDPDTAKRYALAASDLAIFLRQYSGKQPAQIAKTLSAEKLTKKNVLRLINALGKIDIAIELIESVIDAGEKVLVFSSFIEPLDKLKEHFKDKAVMITGTTDVKDREEVVRVFQNDPNVPVFLGGIRSAGVGITLTAASNVIFLDFPWNPADYQQAQDRVHRPGQVAKAVNIYQLFAMGTVDEDLREMLNEKQQIFDQVIDGKLAEKSTSDVMEAIERRILNEY